VEAGLDDVRVSYIEDDACDQPSNYCIGAPNSVGLGAVIGWSGSLDVAQDSFTLTVAEAPPAQFGIFFFGPNQQQQSLGDGLLCVGGTLVRLPVTSTDSSGMASSGLDFGLYGLQNGDSLNFQFWYRDPFGGLTGNNLSDGLEVTFCGE